MLDYPDPTIYAAPVFAVTVALEWWIFRRKARAGTQGDLLGYERRDTWASLAMGAASLVTVTAINLGIFWLATWLWQYRVTDLGTGALGWTVALLGWDLAFYFDHRIEHECRLFWANHVNHHSSQHFNLSTALRQPWTPFTSLIFFPPLALVGVAPWLIMVAGGINLIYQYWIHTELIDRCPAWFEAVFNTPSHHRVHHGANPEYLDRNYGGALIVWDRLFGTFEPERARVVFGLTHNITSYNPVVIAFHEYAAIGRDLRAARRWRDRARILWHGPAWRLPAAGSGS